MAQIVWDTNPKAEKPAGREGKKPQEFQYYYWGSLCSHIWRHIVDRCICANTCRSGREFFGERRVTRETMLISLPLICIGLFVLIVFGVILIWILRFIFARANRKVDIAVRRVEGSVNFMWVERRERNHSKSGSTYKTVRVLEMRIGSETFNIDNNLPNIINQGEEWIFYYTSHPFLFLSAEKILKGK
ncbi:MAG: hypothetical protein IPL71_06175 [Anaerolineales bacterium]|uniref:hypothetical protein n=1 Tax=Candidatus Villigracilis proximus TaxID=3140683 RepID=UPI003136135A|nr:hypothetical protein [Anaerolineales bacterium]